MNKFTRSSTEQSKASSGFINIRVWVPNPDNSEEEIGVKLTSNIGIKSAEGLSACIEALNAGTLKIEVVSIQEWKETKLL